MASLDKLGQGNKLEKWKKRKTKIWVVSEEEKVKSKDNCAKRIRKGNKNLSGNGGTGTGRGESRV